MLLKLTKHYHFFSPHGQQSTLYKYPNSKVLVWKAFNKSFKHYYFRNLCHQNRTKFFLFQTFLFFQINFALRWQEFSELRAATHLTIIRQPTILKYIQDLICLVPSHQSRYRDLGGGTHVLSDNQVCGLDIKLSGEHHIMSQPRFSG